MSHLAPESWTLPWNQLGPVFEKRLKPILRISANTEQVWYRGCEVQLRPTPFRMLLALAKKPGAALTRDELIRKASKKKEYDIDPIKWLRDNKHAIVKSLRSAAEGYPIVEGEIDNLIELRRGVCKLNLSCTEVLVD